MKVFNKGGRTFQHHELAIRPGVATEIPEKYQEAITKLLKDYSSELITDEQANKAAAELTKSVTELRSINANLTAEIEKLKKEVNGAEVVGDAASIAEELKTAKATIAEREKDLRAAIDRISELERIVGQHRDNEVAHKKALQTAADKNAALEAQLSGKKK